MIDTLRNYFLTIRPSAMGLTVVLIGLIVVFFVKYQKEMAPRMGTLEWIRNYDRPRFTLDGRRHPLERKDFLPLLILTAAYAVVAFTNLGSAEAPQSFFSFTEEKDVVELDLGQKQTITSVMYYTGLYPGDYDLFFSSNGSNWIRLRDDTAMEGEDAAMPQSYADLFKWQYAKSDRQSFEARYIRIAARNLPMELGELALYGSDGELIEDMFRRYGAQGLEECYFTAMVKPPVSMDTLKFLTSHHVDCSSYLSKYHKCSAVEFAEKKCGEYPDDDGYKAALELLKQAMLTDRA